MKKKSDSTFGENMTKKHTKKILFDPWKIVFETKKERKAKRGREKMASRDK